MERKRYRLTDEHTCRQMYVQTVRWTNRQIDRWTTRQMDKQTEKYQRKYLLCYN